MKIAVVVCSDTIAKNKKGDSAGKKIISHLEKYKINVKNYNIIPDDKLEIEYQISMLLKKNMDIILFCGGTGLSPRDITPETISPLLHREIPGIMEAARSFGQEKTPYAMLSRGIAGMINNTLIITLPGSTKGADETMQALFPFVFHIFQVSKGQRHK
nr:bifunctional molybdenum cofactor biosynthesis protein MoaC/MoaB [Chitinophagaceae bacterium]